MIFFLYFLSQILFIPIFSQKDTKICIHCKHFRKDFFSTNKFGKCDLFPISAYDNNKYYFVDGSKDKPNYYFCSTARHFNEMCGEQGKLFVPK